MTAWGVTSEKKFTIMSFASKAQFRRRTCHELNPILELNTWNFRRLNQLRMASWLLTGLAVLPAYLSREFRLWKGFDLEGGRFMCQT